MKEELKPQTDPILEECYRIKAEFSAQFKFYRGTLRLFEGSRKKAQSPR